MQTVVHKWIIGVSFTLRKGDSMIWENYFFHLKILVFTYKWMISKIYSNLNMKNFGKVEPNLLLFGEVKAKTVAQ